MDFGQLDMSNISPAKEYDLLPAGEYPVEITEAEEIQNKNNDGSHIRFELTVTHGTFTGRKLWTRLHLNNPSDKAMEIAKSQLISICEATGLNPRNESELLGGTMKVKVVQTRRKDNGEMVNEVKGFKVSGAPVETPFTKTIKPTPVARPAWPGTSKKTQPVQRFAQPDESAEAPF
jgi:hypothetical protein